MRDPDRTWIVEHGGIQVARPELVALQLFAIRSYGRAERVVDRLWSQRMLSGRSLATLLGDLGRRGRNGTAALRLYLDARGPDYRPPDSGLESRFQQLLASAGIAVRRQVDLGGEHEWSGRVDFLHEELPLVIEVQSGLYHSSLTDSIADATRIASLVSDGFRVLEVTDEQVWTRPQETIRRVRDEIAALSVERGDPERRFRRL
jgi:very-short-patch-repair endonuclease